MNMSKKIALVGHCGPDSSYLRMTVMKAAGTGAQILMADDDSELAGIVAEGVELAVFEREVGDGFLSEMGEEAIKRLRGEAPKLKLKVGDKLALSLGVRGGD